MAKICAEDNIAITLYSTLAGAARATELILTPEELLYLEEAYVPHKLVEL